MRKYQWRRGTNAWIVSYSDKSFHDLPGIVGSFYCPDTENGEVEHLEQLLIFLPG